MKAVVVHGAHDLRIDEVPDPIPTDDNVVVAMEWGGICGFDVAYVQSGVSGTATLKDPLILGHEGAGRVVHIGQDAAEHLAGSGIEVGSAVTMHPATLVGAGSGLNHRSPQSNLWPRVRYFGSAAFDPHEAGLFSSQRAVRPDQLRAVPAGVTTREAALAEPFGVALHALNRAGDVSGRTVLVNGCGPIGALAVAAARAAGAGQVIAADLSPTSLRIAEEMGADRIIDLSSGEQLPVDVDVAVEASGAPQAWGDVIAAIRRGGTMVQVGNLPLSEVGASLGGLVTREINLRGSYRFVDEITDALALMAQGLDVTPLMTHEVPMDEAERGFELAADRTSGSSKVMIKLA